MTSLLTNVQLEGELYNGRVAMLAVVGILTVEALGRGPWWQAYNTVSCTSIVVVARHFRNQSSLHNAVACKVLHTPLASTCSTNIHMHSHCQHIHVMLYTD